MFSYWEQQSFTEYDHVVVGAGIVGLSVAIELKEKFPDDSVLVLERGLLPTGASTSNAGFACMGSITELLDDLQHIDVHEVVTLFQWRKQGLQLLRHRLGDARIGYAAHGSYELIGGAELDALEKIDYLNDILSPYTGKAPFARANDKIDTFGFSKKHTLALIENTCEGQLDSGKAVRALVELAIEKGVEIRTGALVEAFDESSACVHVTITDPFRQASLVLRSKTLSICTNAFTRQLLPNVDVTPGRGQVLVTNTIPGLKFRGTFHFDKGYYYFRELDGRVLFGGGRNLDFETETTTHFDLNQMIQQDLENKLAEIILPGQDFKIEYRWAGIMAFGTNKFPIVKAFSSRVFGAFRMGGMGVALGSLSAQQMVELVAQNQ